jgi:hypothetical protein
MHMLSTFGASAQHEVSVMTSFRPGWPINIPRAAGSTPDPGATPAPSELAPPRLLDVLESSLLDLGEAVAHVDGRLNEIVCSLLGDEDPGPMAPAEPPGSDAGPRAVRLLEVVGRLSRAVVRLERHLERLDRL